MAMELLGLMADISIQHIPYKRICAPLGALWRSLWLHKILVLAGLPAIL
jgi:hypothetical protein